MELDERTDKKILETLSQVDDTRFCPDGCRIGGKWAQGPMIYMESFNCLEPGRREYFQIQQQKSGIFFSATHESIYMRMELGDIYPSIFGKSNDIEYWIHLKSLDDIPEDQQRIRHVFDHMLVLLHAGDSPIDALQTDEDTQLTEQLLCFRSGT